MPRSQFPLSFDVSSRDLKFPFGFAVDGFSHRDLANYPSDNNPDFFVDFLGDVNGDGVGDFSITMPSPIKGNTASNQIVGFVIFGQSGLGSAGTFDITTLTGENGFVVPNLFTGTHFFYGITGIGDINGDGIADFSIGGSIDASNNGNNYIIFGKVGIGATGKLDSSALVSSNGFLLTGFKAFINQEDQQNFWMVRSLGDVNADGFADFSIVASDASYVIFGANGIGSNAVFNLASLMGSNGFQIMPTPGNTYLVSGIGDINDDGIADLALSISTEITVIFGKSGLGEYGENSFTSIIDGFTINGFDSETQVFAAGDLNGDGKSDILMGTNPIEGFYAYSSQTVYVLFGDSRISLNGAINIAALNGKNGFKITDAADSMDLTSFGHADFNADGIEDLIISQYGSKQAVMLFGKPGMGKTGHLDLSTLTDQESFVIHFPHDSDAGASFTAGDINNDGISDLIFSASGDLFVNSYSASIGAFVFLGDSVVDLTRNYLNVTDVQPVILSTQNLNASYVKFGSRNSSLIYSISNPQHGHFELVAAPGTVISSFTEQQLQKQQVQFVPDRCLTGFYYEVSVGDGSYAGFYPPVAATIDIDPAAKIDSAASACGNTTSKAALGGGIAAGALLFTYMAARCRSSCKNSSDLETVLEREARDNPEKLSEVEQRLVEPLLSKMIKRIKTTNFIGARSNTYTVAYVKAIEHLIKQLTEAGINLQDETSTKAKQEQFLDAVVRETHSRLLANRSYCSKAYLYSFFTAEIKPEDLELQAQTIARAIATICGPEGIPRVIIHPNPGETIVEMGIMDINQKIEREERTEREGQEKEREEKQKEKQDREQNRIGDVREEGPMRGEGEIEVVVGDIEAVEPGSELIQNFSEGRYKII